MKKLVMMLGVLLIAGSGMTYAGGCCGGNVQQANCCGGRFAGGYGNASCCSFNSVAPSVNVPDCCAPGGSNSYQRKTSQAPMGPQFPPSN